jgi:hypothetical protein
VSGLQLAGIRSRVPNLGNLSSLLYKPSVQAGASILLGIVMTGLAYLVLAGMLAPAVEPEVIAPVEQPAPAPAEGERSFALAIAAGKVAAGVPVAGSEMVATAAVPGDRIDVIALVPPGHPTPLAAVVVRGATVLGRSGQGSSSQLLLQLSSDEAMVLAHLLQSGTRMSYSLWPADGTPLPVVPVDAAELRSLFQQQVSSANATP